MMARAHKAFVAVGIAALTGAAALGAGCGGNEASGVGNSKLPEGVRSEALDHEACEESGHRVDVLDANNDGKADVKRVYDQKTGKEVCRITDLNHDGKPDMYEYYDANGTIRRREADYDDSGVIDAVEYFEGGRLVRRELDTTGQRRIDTWDFFDPATGKRLRRERDSTNDGRIDQWWVWNGDQVQIAIDRNLDGKPDPESAVTIGQAPAGPPDAGDTSQQANVPDAAPAAPAVAPAPATEPDAGPPPVADAGPPPKATKKGGKK